MNRKAMIGAAIGIPLLIIAGFGIWLLGKGDKLPGQSQPTRIPTVAAFASPVGTSVAAGATVAPTTAAATTAAPTTAAAATSSTGSAATTSAVSPARPTTAASSVTSGTAPAASAAGSTAPSGSSVAAGGPIGTVPAGANAYVVTDKSQAKTTVNEKLASLPTNSDAVHTTNAFRGQLVLGQDGKPTTGSSFEVDLRTMKSDQARRDNYIQMNTLETAKFPLATFNITGVDGWNGPLKDGQQATFKLLGMMTIHGVTKPVTFDTTAAMQGDTINGTAVTSFKFADFDMKAPTIANFVSASDTIKLELTIATKKAA